MGKDLNCWVHWQPTLWQYMESNCNGNLTPTNLGCQNRNPVGFPAYINPCGYNDGGNTLAGPAVSKLLQRSSAFLPSMDPLNVPSEATAQKRFLVFDQSGDQTSLFFSSVGPLSWNPNHVNPKTKPFDPCGLRLGLPGNNELINQSDETNVSDGQGCEEMHEDTEEINALLYSDSEDGEEEEEEETSTGHSPVVVTESTEEIASHSMLTKKRRLDEKGEMDAAVIDTASSSRVHHKSHEYNFTGSIVDDESSCVKIEAIGRQTELQELPGINGNGKRKREGIHETVGVLRKIIPGGKGKDTMVVLDEAIQYLRSLNFKAKALGAALMQQKQ